MFCLKVRLLYMNAINQHNFNPTKQWQDIAYKNAIYVTLPPDFKNKFVVFLLLFCTVCG